MRKMLGFYSVTEDCTNNFKCICLHGSFLNKKILSSFLIYSFKVNRINSVSSRLVAYIGSRRK